MRHRFVRDLCDSGCEKFKKFLARRGGALGRALVFGRVKVVHFFELHLMLRRVRSLPAGAPGWADECGLRRARVRDNDTEFYYMCMPYMWWTYRRK